MAIEYGGAVLGRSIETSPDLLVRGHVELYVDDDELDVVLTLSLVYSEKLGRYSVQRVEAERRDDSVEIIGSTLRDVRVHEYMRDGLLALEVVEMANGQPFRFSDVFEQRSKIVAAGPSDAETLRWVARVYRSAQIVSARPAKSVQDVLGLTQPTATVWIRRARGKFLLGLHGFEERRG